MLSELYVIFYCDAILFKLKESMSLMLSSLMDDIRMVLNTINLPFELFSLSFFLPVV